MGKQKYVRWSEVDSVLRVARAAEGLSKQGAREPALILYRELARTGVVADRAVDRAGPFVDDRIGRVRAEVAAWLREELGPELERASVTWRAVPRALAVLVLFALGVVVLVRVHSPVEISEGAHWTASSSWDASPASGVLPRHGFFFSPAAYFFHTNAEPRPWLSIDLGRERVVSEVRIRNRSDSCRERARAVTIEVSRDGQVFERVAEHPNAEPRFLDWSARFAAVRARFVRIVGTPNENMHLSDVRVFGS